MSVRVTLQSLVDDDVVLLNDGYRTKKSELSNYGYRIIRVADVADGNVKLDSLAFVHCQYERQIGGKAAQEGDILLTTKGTVGRVAVMPRADEFAVYSPQLCYFRVLNKERLAPGYLKHWLSSPEFIRQASMCMDKTDMAAYINLRDLASMTLLLPEPSEQRAIAEVLGALDDKIAANDRLVAVAEQLMVAELSRAKGRVRLSELTELSRVSVAPVSLGESLVRHYSLPAFDANRLPVTEKANGILSSKFALPQPVVLISKLNPRFPRVWNVPHIDGTSLASTEFVILPPTGVSTSVLWAALSQPGLGQGLVDKASGTSGSHQRVRPQEILDAWIVNPFTLPGQVRDRVTEVGLRAHHARLESARMAALRDALLPELMSGRLRVKDAESHVEEVL